MFGAIKEIVKDTYIFLRDMWFAIEDFFEFKVWPHRLEWLIGLTGLLTAFNIIPVSYTHLTLPTKRIV